MAFATATELATFTGDSSLDGARGTMLVDQASAVIRTYTRQTFDLVTDDEVELRGTWRAGLQLPERPVVDVTAVAVDGTTVTDFHRVRDVLYRGFRDDADHQVNRAHWGGPETVVTVTYSHGFSSGAAALETLKGVCLQIAARAALNTSGMSSESIGDWSASWGNGGGGFALTAAEQSILDRYRHEYAA